jgi:hypothetical protein
MPGRKGADATEQKVRVQSTSGNFSFVCFIKVEYVHPCCQADTEGLEQGDHLVVQFHRYTGLSGI